MIRLAKSAQRILICAWCGKEMDRFTEPWEPHDYESHGICTKCNSKHFGRIKRLDEGER